jgi:hypothetical protein
MLKITSLVRMNKTLSGHFHDEWDRILEDIQITRQYMQKLRSEGKIPQGLITYAPVMCDFLIHFRILHEFFHGDPTKKRNANAKHYIPNWSKKRPERIRIWNDRINEFLAHLSYSRTRGWKTWPMPDLLYPYYKRLTIRFIKKLPDKHKSPRLDSLTQRLGSEDFRI